jgi:glycosyltransferase involved in cell wall biosynthesis
LFLGTLEARKNPLFLLNVLTELLARGNRVKLLLCGTGPLVKTIQCEIRRRRLEDTVVLTGVIPEEQKPDYYNLADVFLFPSALEGFGMVLGEAMSCGKPVVAFNTSSVGELVEDGVSGFLVKPGDQAEFVRRTLALLTNEQLRVRMGNRAKERVDRLFRWERATSETRGIYEETIGRFRSGASAPGPVS